jgi:hypothetical protein
MGLRMCKYIFGRLYAVVLGALLALNAGSVGGEGLKGIGDTTKHRHRCRRTYTYTCTYMNTNAGMSTTRFHGTNGTTSVEINTSYPVARCNAASLNTYVKTCTTSE